METRALLAALLELPAVRPEVQELGFNVLDGVITPTFQQDLRHAWAIVNGDPAPTASGGEAATSDLLTSVASELRALRAEVARRATPYEGTADWIEDVVSALPPLLEQGEAARALGVDPRTIRRMINRGELKSVDVGEGGRGRSCGVRIPRAAIADFLRQKEARGQRPSSP
jgi:excisionase family DNA binding protein